MFSVPVRCDEAALRDGYTHVLGLVPVDRCLKDVAASYWPAVEAATTKFPPDVAASLVPAVEAATTKFPLDVAASLVPAVAVAANRVLSRLCGVPGASC